MQLTKFINNINLTKILNKIFIFAIFLYALSSHISKSAISVGVGLVILIWWLKIIIVRDYKFDKPIKYWPFLLMLILFVFSRNEIEFILDSRTTSKIFLGVFFFLALINELDDKKTIKRLIYLTTIIVTISSIYAGYQYLFEDVRRAYGFSRFSITQGNIAVMGAGVCLPFLFRKKNKIWQYIVFAGAFLINTSAILFSLTRGSYLAWIIVVLIFALIKYPKALPILLIAFILTYSFLPANIQNRFFSSFDPNESSFKTRVSMWQTSVDIMKERPLLGIGLDNFPSNIPEEFEITGFRSDHRHAHNNYFHFGAETGIPAMLLLIYGNYLIIKKLFLAYWLDKNDNKNNDKTFYLALLLGILGFLLSGLTVANFIDFQSNHYFWFLAGSGLALIKIKNQNIKPEVDINE
ncbi:MAG: O-antigen ligase family protein [bacterium]